jgi:diguanylate cyclase (GGDEF)-like protein
MERNFMISFLEHSKREVQSKQRLRQKLLSQPKRTLHAICWVEGFSWQSSIILSLWGILYLMAVITRWHSSPISFTLIALLLSQIVAEKMESTSTTSVSVVPTTAIYFLDMALLGPTLGSVSVLIIYFLSDRRRLVNRISNALNFASIVYLGALGFKILDHATGGYTSCLAHPQGSAIPISSHCGEYLGGAAAVFLATLIINILLVYVTNFVPRMLTRSLRFRVIVISFPMVVISVIIVPVVLYLRAGLGPLILLAMAFIVGLIYLSMYRLQKSEELTHRLETLSGNLKSERLYRVLANSMSDTTFIFFDLDSSINAIEGGGIFTNQLRSSLLGNTINEALFLENRTRDLAKDMLRLALLGEENTFDMNVPGHEMMLEVHIAPVWEDDKCSVRGALALVRDVTFKRQEEARLERLAMYDSLTSLANRSTFSKELEFASRRAKTGNQSTILMFDLDHFKQVNDSYGHAVGDELLQVIAQRLQASVRQGDLAARLAGDEFAAILKGSLAHDERTSLIKRLMASVALPVHLANHTILPGGSLGASIMDEQHSLGEETLHQADVAMYSAKKSEDYSSARVGVCSIF